jgi:hypothetical protein
VVVDLDGDGDGDDARNRISARSMRSSCSVFNALMCTSEPLNFCPSRMRSSTRYPEDMRIAQIS